jgi:hypothetical protein
LLHRIASVKTPLIYNNLLCSKNAGKHEKSKM